MLARTAGVKHLVVVINKMDDSTVNWSIERYVASVRLFIFVLPLRVSLNLFARFANVKLQ